MCDSFRVRRDIPLRPYRRMVRDGCAVFRSKQWESKFRVFIGKQEVNRWIADDQLPTSKPGGDSSTRRRISGLALRPGDDIRIEGVPDGGEHAVLDYVELHRLPE